MHYIALQDVETESGWCGESGGAVYRVGGRVRVRREDTRLRVECFDPDIAR